MAREWRSYFKEGQKPKKQPKPIKRTAIKKKFNATGEKDIFESVLDSIPDTEETKCFVCGKRIAIVTHHNFAHILAKGRYPKFRLNPDNIRIMCYNYQGSGCHSKLDFYPKSELTDPMWDKVWELKERLINEYKQLNIK